MPKLSVTIIAYNEEANIQGALESVKWADEIVVVDSLSTDQTVDICRQYTSRVFLHTWEGYARQKNLAAELASHDWIINLDADERVTPELREELQTLLRTDPRCDGYSVARRNHFLGRWIRGAGWYPDYVLRLYDKRRGRYPDREVHEKVEVRGQIGQLHHPMEHYTYRSIGAFLDRMDRYSTLAVREMVKEGIELRWLDCAVRPFLAFIKMYFLRQGFRDGTHGIVLAGLYAGYTFAKYVKRWEIG